MKHYTGMRTSDLQLPRMVWMKSKPQCWSQESRHRGSGLILYAHYLYLSPTVWWDLYKIQTQAKQIHAVLGQDSDSLWGVEAEGDLVDADTLWFSFCVLVPWLGSVLENSLNSSFITCALFCMYLTFLKVNCNGFELWCWGRLLRVLWTARRSNQSIKGNQSWIFIGRTWCWSWSTNTLATWCEELTH